MSAPIRVVIADDHPMYRFGLHASLTSGGHIDVVAEAETGLELMGVVDRYRPDVVLTDLSMPGLDGAGATSRILQRYPAMGVLILTMHDEDEALFAALRAGARGYLLKDAERDDIVRALLAAAAGDAVSGPSVARRTVDFFTGTRQRYASQSFRGTHPSRARRSRPGRDRKGQPRD